MDLTLPDWVETGGINKIFKVGRIGMLLMRIKVKSQIAVGTTNYIIGYMPAEIRAKEWITLTAVTMRGVAFQLLANPSSTNGAITISYPVSVITVGDEIMIQIPIIF